MKKNLDHLGLDVLDLSTSGSGTHRDRRPVRTARFVGETPDDAARRHPYRPLRDIEMGGGEDRIVLTHDYRYETCLEGPVKNAWTVDDCFQVSLLPSRHDAPESAICSLIEPTKSVPERAAC